MEEKPKYPSLLHELMDRYAEQIKWLDDPYAQKAYFELFNAYVYASDERDGRDPERMKKYFENKPLDERVFSLKLLIITRLYRESNTSLIPLEVEPVPQPANPLIHDQ